MVLWAGSQRFQVRCDVDVEGVVSDLEFVVGVDTGRVVVTDGSSDDVTVGRDKEIAVRVPNGWSRSSWMDRLEYLSEACRDLRPDLSKKYRVQAERLRHDVNAESGDYVIFVRQGHERRIPLRR